MSSLNLCLNVHFLHNSSIALLSLNPFIISTDLLLFNILSKELSCILPSLIYPFESKQQGTTSPELKIPKCDFKP